MGLTRKRDLRDGNAVWARYQVPKILGAPLRRSLRAEVVVVGAGISFCITDRCGWDIMKRARHRRVVD